MLAKSLLLATLLATLLGLAACSGDLKSAGHGNSLSEGHAVTKKGTGGR